MKAGRLERPLPLALGLGIIAGILLGLSGPSTSFHHVPASLLYTLFGIGATCGFFIFPGIISFLARRNYFAWGFVPASVCMLILPIMIYMTSRDDPFRLSVSQSVVASFKDLPRVTVLVCGGVLLSSGPLSLIRLRVDRRRGSATVSENGVPIEIERKEGPWPPPPAVK